MILTLLGVGSRVPCSQAREEHEGCHLGDPNKCACWYRKTRIFEKAESCRPHSGAFIQTAFPIGRSV